LQQALESQHSKAAGTVRGTLGGNASVSGLAGMLDQMKSTLKGSGKLTLTQAELIGVNVGSEALKKVQNVPAIGDLVPAEVISRHPELFDNPNTDIDKAGLSFTLEGPRIVTHDLNAQTADYNLLGDGWFDMDRNIDLAAQIVLSQRFSGELIAAKKNVTYLADRGGQVIVPLRISGQLPKPKVAPDVAQLAQRAGQHAIQGEGQKVIQKLLGKHGLGGLFGGGNN
jgi:AsmA-like C-terminal region